MHWNGRRWSTLALPRDKVPAISTELAGPFMAAGARNVWVARSTQTGTQIAHPLYLEHWNAVRWQRIGLRKPTTVVNEISRDGHGGVWVVTNGSAPAFKWFFDHFSAGHWTRTALPAATGTTAQQITDLAWIPGTRSEWALGNLLPIGSNTDVQGGIWKFGK